MEAPTKTLTAITGMAVIFLMSSFSCFAATEVVAEGKARGDVANAREVALTDALREAVRVGVGVDLVEKSRVRDFILDYDQVFASSFGHVKSYRVLEAGLGGDKIYRVKIRAVVEKGQPGIKDRLALKMLINAKGSPRIALEVDELIEGVPSGSTSGQSWFEEATRDMGLRLVDTKRVTRQDDRLAERDRLLGNPPEQTLRGISQEADYILKVKIRGRHAGQKELYQIPVNVFAFTIDLTALQPDTGAIIASAPLPAIELSSRKKAPDAAARDILWRILEGTSRKDDKSAWLIFRRVFAHWVAELDLGAVRRLEFAKITDAEFDHIQQCLGGTKKVSGVWPREFDSQGLSFIDVETRLTAPSLKAVVIDALQPTFVADRYSRNYLQFKRAAKE